MRQKLENMIAADVWEIVWSLRNKMDDASDMVFTIGLEVLEGKVSEEKYLELLSNL